MKLTKTKSITIRTSKLASLIVFAHVASAMEPSQIHEEESFVMCQTEKKENQFTVIQQEIKNHVSKYPALFSQEQFDQKCSVFLEDLGVLVKDELLLRCGADENVLNKEYHKCLSSILIDYKNIIELFPNDEVGFNNLIFKQPYDKGFLFITEMGYSHCKYQLKACKVIVQESTFLSESYLKQMEKQFQRSAEDNIGVSSEAILGMMIACDKLKEFVHNHHSFMLEILEERKGFLAVICSIRKLLDLKSHSELRLKIVLEDSLARMETILVLSRSILAKREFISDGVFSSDDKIPESENRSDIENSRMKSQFKREELKEKGLPVKEKKKLLRKSASISELTNGSVKKNYGKSSSDSDLSTNKEDFKNQEKKKKSDNKGKKQISISLLH